MVATPKKVSGVSVQRATCLSPGRRLSAAEFDGFDRQQHGATMRIHLMTAHVGRAGDGL
jgi:hypothetical protein